MQNKNQLTARQIFKKYTENITVEGQVAELGVVTEQVITDVDGNEVVIDRKEEPIFNKSKDDIIASLNQGLVQLKAEQALAVDKVVSQINELNNL